MSTPPPSDRRALVEQAQALCREHGATQPFLPLFGSSLYGTVSPGRSDVDARGIFLPSPESPALNKAPKSLHFSTGDDSRRKAAAFVEAASARSEQDRPVLPTGRRKADLDGIFRTVLAAAWSDKKWSLP